VAAVRIERIGKETVVGADDDHDPSEPIRPEITYQPPTADLRQTTHRQARLLLRWVPQEGDEKPPVSLATRSRAGCALAQRAAWREPLGRLHFGKPSQRLLFVPCEAHLAEERE
jgi:hypothetical protein